MDRERFDRGCELIILALVLAILLFGPLATGAVRTQDFLVLQTLSLGVLGVWLVRLWSKPHPTLLWPPVCWAVVAFVGYACARYAFSEIEYVARKELIQIVVYAFLFFAIINNLHRREAAEVISLALIGLATAISLYAVYQFMTNSQHVWHFAKPATYAGRASGTYICPNHLAGFLGLLLPLVLTLTFTGRLGHVARLLLSYAFLAMLAGLIVTVSRGGWVASGLSLLVLLAVLIQRRRLWLPVILVVAVVAGSGIYFYRNTLIAQRRAEATRKIVEDKDLRLYYWPAAWRIWRDHPLWGVGGGHFDHYYRHYREASNRTQGRPGWAHNDYLNALVDYGLAGTAIILITVGLVGWGVWRCWKHVRRGVADQEAKPSNKFAVVLGIAVGLLALTLHSFVDFNLHIPANAILAVALMALLSSYWRFATDDYWMGLRWRGKTLATLVLLGGMAWLGWMGWRGFKEYQWLARATRAADTASQLAAWKAAFALEPNNADTAYAIGETLRRQSWLGHDDYRPLALEAMDWFRRGMDLNRHDCYSPMRYGMCLHWLKRHAEAEPYFQRAIHLDPNSYYMRAHLGWHYFQLGDYAKAKEQFDRSRRLNWDNNPIADSYLKIIAEKLAEKSAPEAAPAP